MSGVLYISYDGMLEPLGQSQVFAYIEKLAADRPIHLLSFEKAEDWACKGQREAIARRIKAAGIHWHPRRYHKRPSSLATAWDIAVGTLSALYLVLRWRVGIIHARSDVPALMAWPVAWLTRAAFLFDMRGFWADERVDGNLWPRDGRLYRVAKWFERKFLLSADHVVSLTHAAVREMSAYPWLEERMPPMTVIPTCADLARFSPGAQRPEGLVIGYVGSVGTWYLFDEVVTCFVQLCKLRPDARLLIINRNEHAYIHERLAAGGVEPESFELRNVEHEDVPAQIRRMHAGVFFIKPVFSKQASAPTKFAEFLGCGIPCLSNAGVGDMAEILENERVGIALRDFESVSIAAGVQGLLRLLADGDVHDRCVRAARKHFSLEQGVEAYGKIYGTIERG